MRWSRPWLAGGVAVLLVGGGSATAYALNGSDQSSEYRTVAAKRTDVLQTMSTTGTVDSSSRADLGFGASGTVSRVAATEGSTVKAGTVLAVLDRSTLDADLASAKAALAKARAQLEDDEDAQDDTVASSASGTGTGGKTGGASPSTGRQRSTGSGGAAGGAPSSGPSGGASGGSGVDTSAVQKALARLHTQQKDVLDAQTTASGAIAAAESALDAQTSACKDAFQQADGNGGAGGAADQACTDALAQVQSDQGTVSTAQGALADTLSTLARTLTDAVTALGRAASGSTTRASAFIAPATSGRGIVTSSLHTVAYVQDLDAAPSSPGADRSTTVTAATLASDQAAIDTARAGLLTADRSLSGAIVRTPISGKVARVDVAPSDAVSAGDPVVTVIAGKGVVVTAAIGESSIRDIAVGQGVRVTIPGSDATSAGRVAAIAVSADSDSGSATYPVTIAVDDPASDLPAGSSVLLDIVLGTAKDVISVPTSAVRKQGDRTTVRTVTGGRLTTVAVTTGIAGTTRTQVTKGLSAGTRVVLADLDEAVSGASTSLSPNQGGQGRAGFRGGTGPPGGAGGPPG